MKDIRFPRGDLFCFPFGVYIDDASTQTAMDRIWFTVKKHYTDKQVIFQKTLAGGGIIDAGGGAYIVRIEPEDTEGMEFGLYDFDIQVEKGEEIKKTFMGRMELTGECTHRGDEDYQPEILPDGTVRPGPYTIASAEETGAIIEEYEG